MPSFQKFLEASKVSIAKSAEVKFLTNLESLNRQLKPRISNARHSFPTLSFIKEGKKFKYLGQILKLPKTPGIQ